MLNTPAKPVTQASTTYLSFAESLASKLQPTLLYAAPPHTLYMLSSYTAAFFCFSYAAYNFNAGTTFPRRPTLRHGFRWHSAVCASSWPVSAAGSSLAPHDS